MAALVAGSVYFLVFRDDGDGDIAVQIGGPGPTAPTSTTTAAAPNSAPTSAVTGGASTQPLPSAGQSTTVAAGSLPPAVPMDFVGGDAALDALANACFAGDMELCDDLYRQAEPNSDYERYGDTCAGRQAPNTGRFCTSVFPSVTTVPKPTSTSTSTTVT